MPNAETPDIEDAKAFVTDPEFLAMVAHELAGPLNAVILRAQLLERKLGDRPEAPRATAVVSSARRVASVLQSFRRMLGRDVSTPQPAALASLLDEGRREIERHIPDVSLFVSDIPEAELLASRQDMGALFLELVRYVRQTLAVETPICVDVDLDGDTVRVRVGEAPAREGEALGPELHPPFDHIGSARVEGIGLHYAWLLAADAGGRLHRCDAEGAPTALWAVLPLR